MRGIELPEHRYVVEFAQVDQARDARDARHIVVAHLAIPEIVEVTIDRVAAVEVERFDLGQLGVA